MNSFVKLAFAISLTIAGSAVAGKSGGIHNVFFNDNNEEVGHVIGAKGKVPTPPKGYTNCVQIPCPDNFEKGTVCWHCQETFR